MDPISASCLNLNSDILTSQILAKQSTDAKYLQILGSCLSISQYEEKNFKNLRPQIIAAILVTSYHITIGISLAYSAILLPQLKTDAEFEVSPSAGSWIASIIALTTPAGSLLVGIIMDHYGRLNTLKMVAIPAVTGWILTATAHNVAMLIIGRGLTGFASALGSNPAIVYLTEIARKDMRGSLISFAPALTSLGMVLTFIMGWFMHWRHVAWLCIIFAIIPSIAVLVIPESPAWLVSKNRIDEARTSLIWINKYQPQPENHDKTLPELQLALLQKEHELKLINDTRRHNNSNVAMVMLREFLKPTGYKPLIILCLLFFFQQFSGIFIFLFYSIDFFQDVGSTFNPYLSSIFIGIVRFVMSMINTYSLRTYGRRPLVILSCLTMALSIFTTAVFAYWLKTGATTQQWVPIATLLLFVMSSMIGLLPIPYTMTAELFPLEIRGAAHSISTCIASLIMFVSLQLYPWMYDTFNGMTGILLFFTGILLLATGYAYVFLPETHGKKLSEIEEYFRSNWVFLWQKQDATSGKATSARRTGSIVKHTEQMATLMEDV